MNSGPSAYQPNALPLGQTGSQCAGKARTTALGRVAAACSARGVAVCCWRRTGGPRRVTATDLRPPGPVREEDNAELTVSVSDSVQQSGHCPSPLVHAAVGTLSFAFGTVCLHFAKLHVPDLCPHMVMLRSHCVPVLVGHISLSSLTQMADLCPYVSRPICPNRCSTLFQFHRFPVPSSPSPIVSQYHRVPAPFVPVPSCPIMIMSHSNYAPQSHYVPAPLCLTVPLCPSPIVPQYHRVPV